jgi:hypothetical protein
MFNLVSMTMGVQMQIIVPTSDVDVGGFETAPLWSKLGGFSPDDSDFVNSLHGQGQESFTVGLSSGARTPSNRSQHRIRIRLAYAGADAPTGNTVVSLIEAGTSTRASFTIPGGFGTSFSEFHYDLTSSEAAAINDYTDLALKVDYDPGAVGLDNEGRVSWLVFQCPKL